MLERLVIAAAALGGMLLYDGLTLRGKLRRQEKWLYAALVCVGLYLGVDYVVNQDWFDLYNIVDKVFGAAAKHMVNMLKA